MGIRIMGIQGEAFLKRLARLIILSLQMEKSAQAVVRPALLLIQLNGPQIERLRLLVGTLPGLQITLANVRYGPERG